AALPGGIGEGESDELPVGCDRRLVDATADAARPTQAPAPAGAKVRKCQPALHAARKGEATCHRPDSAGSQYRSTTDGVNDGAASNKQPSGSAVHQPRRAWH